MKKITNYQTILFWVREPAEGVGENRVCVRERAYVSHFVCLHFGRFHTHIYAHMAYNIKCHYIEHELSLQKIAFLRLAAFFSSPPLLLRARNTGIPFIFGAIM